MTRPDIHTATARLIAALCVTLVASFELHAQGNPDTIDVRSSRISPLEYVATNTGIFGYDPTTRGAGLHYPRSSGQKYLFGSGLWFGARKSNRAPLPLVFYTYNVNTGRSLATPGEFDRGYTSEPPYLYHSVDYSLASGSYTGQDGRRLPPWPLWQSPDRVFSSMFAPGTFEPSPSRRLTNIVQGVPAFAANVDEQMFARYHDGDLGRYEIDSMEALGLGYPIGLQIEQNIFAWELETPNQHVVVISYDIINRSGDTLYDCIASQAAEPDLGTFDNDHLSFYNTRPELRSGYVWSDPETYARYHALGMILVEGPVTGAEGLIDNERRTSYRSDGRAGAFPSWTARPGYDPLTHAERYKLMRDGGFATDQGPGDYRCLLSTTPFAMRPGDTAHFAVAFALIDGVPAGVARDRLGSEELCAYYVESLDKVGVKIMEAYYTPTLPSATYSADNGVNVGGMIIAPNPTRGRSSVEYSVTGPALLRLQVGNGIGQTVIRTEHRTDRAGRYRQELDLSHLPAGLYFVIITGDGQTRSARVIVE